MKFKQSLTTLINKLEFNNEYANEATLSRTYDSIIDGQAPDITLVTCSDSRVLERSIDDQIGKIFTIKNIGNRVQPNMGSIQYGVAYLNTPVLLILGHTSCGAIHASMKGISSEHQHVIESLECLKPIAANVQKLLIKKGGINYYMNEHSFNPENKISEEMYLETLVTEANVDRQIDIVLDDDGIRKMVYAGKLMIVGAIYDFHDIYSHKKGSIFIINVNGETDIPGIKKIDTFASEKLVTDRMKRLLVY